MRWQVIESGRMPPQDIMQKDAELLAGLENKPGPLLHLYEWDGDCLTYGYFTDPSKYLYLQSINRHQIQMARRPTGGGIIFHLTDFAFSVLVPACYPHFSLNTLDNYAYVNRKVIQVINRISPLTLEPELLAQKPMCQELYCHAFCMAKPTQYDIIVQGKKVGGAAQRRTKYGYLHQGSIALALPSLQLLKDVLKEEAIILEAMQANTYTLSSSPDPSHLATLRKAIKQQLMLNFKRSLL